MDTPQYLYKILSLPLWQATQKRNNIQLPAEDNDFIHFSTEDQLDRILDKYWSYEPQAVVLKVDPSKLQGRLVLEANYYHLYEGYIPLNAIKEARILYHQLPDHWCTNKLDLIQIGNPVLRQKGRQLSKEEILSPEIQQLIEEMKATMRAAPGIGLAAPQVGHSLQLAVVEDVNHSHLTAQQLIERERVPVPFHVFINPRLTVLGDTTLDFFEGCLSVLGFIACVPRAKEVRVECLNEYAEPMTIDAKGWYARILQHEIDHLNGILYTDRCHLNTLMTEENYVKHWKK